MTYFCVTFTRVLKEFEALIEAFNIIYRMSHPGVFLGKGVAKQLY